MPSLKRGQSLREGDRSDYWVLLECPPGRDTVTVGGDSSWCRQGTWALGSTGLRCSRASRSLIHGRPPGFTIISASMMEWRLGALPKPPRHLGIFPNGRSSLGRKECWIMIQNEFPISPEEWNWKFNLKKIKKWAFLACQTWWSRGIPPANVKPLIFLSILLIWQISPSKSQLESCFL